MSLVGVDGQACVRSENVRVDELVSFQDLNQIIRTGEAGVSAITGIAVPDPAAWPAEPPLISSWTLAFRDPTYPGQTILQDPTQSFLQMVSVDVGGGPVLVPQSRLFTAATARRPAPSIPPLPLQSGFLLVVFGLPGVTTTFPRTKLYLLSGVFADDDPTYPHCFAVWDQANQLGLLQQVEYRIIPDVSSATVYGHGHTGMDSQRVSNWRNPYRDGINEPYPSPMVQLFDTGSGGPYVDEPISLTAAVGGNPSQWWRVRTIWENNDGITSVKITNGGGNQVFFTPIFDSFGVKNSLINNLDDTLYFTGSGSFGPSTSVKLYLITWR